MSIGLEIALGFALALVFQGVIHLISKEFKKLEKKIDKKTLEIAYLKGVQDTRKIINFNLQQYNMGEEQLSDIEIEIMTNKSLEDLYESLLSE